MKTLKDLKKKLELDGYHVESNLDHLCVYEDEPESIGITSQKYEDPSKMFSDMYKDAKTCPNNAMCMSADDPMNNKIGFVLFETKNPDNPKEYAYEIDLKNVGNHWTKSYLDSYKKRKRVSQSFLRANAYSSWQSVIKSS